ncbi:MAG: AraC family transcriptional regulator [Flavobacterium sp.]|nr:MAG: AraC family transcriptional regulator [Flavobacterium sp.]
MNTDLYPKIYLYKRVVQAKLFIDREYAARIDVNRISDEACFSKYHFIRLFKKTYGQTPHQYLRAVRLGHAKLLFEQGKPVTEVCILVGFESLSSFSGIFKKATGAAPTEYLKQRQQRKREIAANPLNYISACFAYKLGAKNSNFEEALP